jgi:aspartate aminotransferase-like enzyme
MQAQLRETLMDKILLNPGPTNTSEEVKDSQHRWSDVCHRTDEFVELLIDTKEKILKKDSQAKPIVKIGMYPLSLEAGRQLWMP